MTLLLFYIAALDISSPEIAWIGLKDFSNTNSDWRWVSDNTTLTFTNWQDGNPNQDGVCVALPLNTFQAGPIGRWFTADCRDNHDVLCETDRVNANIIYTYSQKKRIFWKITSVVKNSDSNHNSKHFYQLRHV